MEISLTYPAQFEPGLTAAMSQVGLRRHIAAGDKLLDVGDPLVYMPVVLAGALKVLRIDEEGRELLLYYVAPGEGCAMTFTCCMQAVRSEVRVVAEDDSEPGTCAAGPPIAGIVSAGAPSSSMIVAVATSAAAFPANTAPLTSVTNSLNVSFASSALSPST